VNRAYPDPISLVLDPGIVYELELSLDNYSNDPDAHSTVRRRPTPHGEQGQHEEALVIKSNVVIKATVRWTATAERADFRRRATINRLPNSLVAQ
jgi:hypothetical protein